MSLEKQQGLLMGQAVGDALGAQVEFSSGREIERRYPEGVRVMVGGGPWNLMPGQVTDDTEMAYCLAHSLIEAKGFDAQVALKWYRKWQYSKPFDCGNTTRRGLQGMPLEGSQANGALMRVSPLALACQHWEDDALMEAAMADAQLTHPNVVCQDASALFCLLLKRCLTTSLDAKTLVEGIKAQAASLDPEEHPILVDAIERAERQERYPIDEYQAGWVVYAFHNAIYQLLHAPSFEEALVDTIRQGGDTDTTAAICGALMGAYLGYDAIPEIWRMTIEFCEPHERSGATHVRPDFLWPSQTLALVSQLQAIGQTQTPDGTTVAPPKHR